MDRHHSFFVGAMSAAINVSAGLHAMSNNPASAVLALWRERVDGTFEAIEIMGNPIHHDLDRFVVLVSANFTRTHKSLLLLIVFTTLRYSLSLRAASRVARVI